jgi:hypothetical protein
MIRMIVAQTGALDLYADLPEGVGRVHRLFHRP